MTEENKLTKNFYFTKETAWCPPDLQNMAKDFQTDDEIIANLQEQKTLRDEFAMAAMQGFIISGKDMRHASEPNEYASDTVARLAYKYADAMIKHRSKKDD